MKHLNLFILSVLLFTGAPTVAETAEISRNGIELQKSINLILKLLYKQAVSDEDDPCIHVYRLYSSSHRYRHHLL
jgi:hypothetical protein